MDYDPVIHDPIFGGSQPIAQCFGCKVFSGSPWRQLSDHARPQLIYRLQNTFQKQMEITYGLLMVCTCDFHLLLGCILWPMEANEVCCGPGMTQTWHVGTTRNVLWGEALSTESQTTSEDKLSYAFKDSDKDAFKVTTSLFLRV